MKFTSFLTTFAILYIPVLSVSIPRIEILENAIQKRAGSLAITGAPGDTHPRLEIRQMHVTKPNQWTLFLLAMNKFQSEAQSSKTSYYQIAGIHGVPRQNWDNVGLCSTCGGTGATGPDGYCTHDSILFPAWHRAYLALFEQELHAAAVGIANSYPKKKRAAMQTAAKSLRLPYWDWAAHPKSGTPTLPSLVTSQTVSVDAPAGSKTIINPLFRHEFQDASKMRYSPFINWKVRL